MEKFKTITYPKSRIATFDIGKIGSKKHHITGFLEIDVTLARRKIKKKLKSGEHISITSWLIKVIGKTIDDNKYIHAINYQKRSQIVFDDIDISLPIEKIVNGVKVPLATIIRNVNKKSIVEINNEIQEARRKNIKKEKDFVLVKRKSEFLTSLFFNLPQYLRLMIWKYILKNPFRVKDNMGTAIITNIGMLGNCPGWILPKSIHNLCFGLGSIVKKPWVIKNEIKIREILHLTVIFDHDVIDGSPAAIFVDNLVRNIEIAAEL